jgi:hypothetical protein
LLAPSFVAAAPVAMNPLQLEQVYVSLSQQLDPVGFLFLIFCELHMLKSAAPKAGVDVKSPVFVAHQQ